MTGDNNNRPKGDGLSGAVRSLQQLLQSTSQALGAKVDAQLRDIRAQQSAVTPEMPDTNAEEGSPLDEALKLVYRLSSAPHSLGRVVDIFSYETVQGKSVPMVRIVVGNRTLEVHLPLGMVPKCGDAVRLNATTSQIIGFAEAYNTGIMATIREVNDAVVIVEVGGTSRSVSRGVVKGLARGDRVILDETQSMVIYALPKDSKRFMLTREPKNTFDDVVGHTAAVTLLRNVVDIDPKTEKFAKHYGRPSEKGVFLYGPPGCGKTMLGEAIASAIAAKYGKKALESGYMYIVVPDFLDKFVGETERALRSCFEEADRHFEEHGYPAVLVLDECEALFSRRGTGKSSDMEKTVVPTILGLLNDTTALVILMTNRPDVIDPAVIRDGRCGRQIFVGRPTRESAEIIIGKNFAKYPIDPNGSSMEVLVRIATEGFFDPARRLIDEPLRLADGSDAYFTLANIINGAMLTRLVVDAATLAEARDRASGKLTGINEADVLKALDMLFADKKRLDYSDELNEFYSSMKDRLPKDILLQSGHS